MDVNSPEARAEKLAANTNMGMNLDQQEHYREFVQKSLDEQAEEITSDLIWRKQNLLFDFDNQDDIKREDYVKEIVGAGIFFTLVTAIDIRVLN